MVVPFWYDHPRHSLSQAASGGVIRMVFFRIHTLVTRLERNMSSAFPEGGVRGWREHTGGSVFPEGWFRGWREQNDGSVFPDDTFHSWREQNKGSAFPDDRFHGWLEQKDGSAFRLNI